ncbi:hypothetical protein F2Q68_00000605 [Brassica cretica]|uniref:Uncharacterized protein n=1 Tax=Brassica cretica TaxID=69181 RepID=A0A8S9J7D1_BRACR|nr:hypothetical protein F2Q68_00000605 [Brassica cretica]
MRGSLCPDPIPVNLTTVLTVLVRTKVLKCLSKSQVKVTILKLEAFEIRWESFVILSASGSFEDLSNTLSTLSKLVYLSFYRFSCFVVVATRLAHRISAPTIPNHCEVSALSRVLENTSISSTNRGDELESPGLNPSFSGKNLASSRFTATENQGVDMA